MPDQPHNTPGSVPNPSALGRQLNRQRQNVEAATAPRQPAPQRPAPRRLAAQPQANAPRRPKTEYEPDTGAPFLNPYTFVPVAPQSELPEVLRDARPLGHDRLHRNRWTGAISVRLTVQTPLLLLDSARAVPDTENTDHLIYPVLYRGRPGQGHRPHLPATSLKGMLRSAYEAVTGSRFGVFDVHEGPHTRPLGWRRTAQRMRPVRVTDDGEQLEFCDAVRLPFYGRNTPLKYRDTNQIPEHGDEALVRYETRRGIETIVEIATMSDGEAYDSEDFYFGYVFLTGPNAVKKQHAQVFLTYKEPQAKPLSRQLRDGWNKIIENYENSHTEAEIWERRDANEQNRGPGECFGEEPGKLAWSPHLWQKDRKVLGPRTLCYALERGGRIVNLYPVAIPRDISMRTPAEMLDDSLYPAPTYEQLSPADRVFGWVAPEGSSVRPASYRGRLRLRDAECVSTEGAVTEFADEKGLPLAILGQPKPSQGRFYLADKSDTILKDDSPRTKEKIYYATNLELRGRKVYWHHARIADEARYWEGVDTSGQDPTQENVSGKGYREYRRPREIASDVEGPSLTEDGQAFATAGDAQRDSQNRSVRGWVNKDTEFTFTVEVRDLSDAELGALLWLLTLDRGQHHRIGLGKPLGFGSVHLSIDESKTDLYSTDQWVEYYGSLSADAQPDGPSAPIAGIQEVFDALVSQSKALKTMREAFLAAAQGKQDLPVHYPRARPLGMADGSSMPPDPRGQSYEWFTANERVSRGEILGGHGRSLPAATSTDKELHLYKEMEIPDRN
ncbi:TIGR03986 family type III CRISPR-associated RAMP protein [Actinomadura napierensis]|uniref:TIGR03986 family CRISPR-associated RAMP protein n=1 Tax=Actinomadura napierensis TaxID=267854 RepID=A0ABN3AEZ2_9ACTN